MNMEEKMIYCRATDTLKCPKCGSKKIYVKSGMMADLYICQECGFEARDLEDEKN